MATEIDNELKKVSGELVRAADTLAGMQAMVIMEDPTDDSRSTLQVPEGLSAKRQVEILASWIDVIRKRQLNWASVGGTG